MVSICEEYGCHYEDQISWPSGPRETTTLRVCTDCGSEYETEMEDQ